MVDYEPKNRPRQARSRATFGAILDATARILVAEGYTGLTTNRIADVAGVGIASVYEYFPGKEAVVAALAERELDAFVERIAGHLPAVVAKGGRNGLQHLFEVTVSEVAAQAALYRVLLREIPFVPTLPGVLQLQERAFTYARAASAQAQPAIRLPDFERDTWLIWQMTYNTLLEIGFGQHAESERAALVNGLVRLVARMLYPGSAEVPPGQP
ncbi:TetR/AcrR family transcriptional regulator [Algiphilus aromaticivorans]|uniref:TetR/AcrR family transcriptional regulator n=1 Tax=Algiphilus aromaticivorans TaxID=382454 RepID=UPI00069497F0|nr:TetR/AcrR family transcriptional regulator [Algiphilus aromaticivorans]